MDADVSGTDSTVSADVRDFFAAFSAASDRDPAGPAGLFGERFLSLDPNSMTVVTREQLAKALLPAVEGGSSEGHDSSTRGLLAYFHELKSQ